MRLFFVATFLFVSQPCFAQNKVEVDYLSKDLYTTDSANAYYKKIIHYYGNMGDGGNAYVKWIILPDTLYKTERFTDYWHNKKQVDSIFNADGSIMKIDKYYSPNIFRTITDSTEKVNMSENFSAIYFLDEEGKKLDTIDLGIVVTKGSNGTVDYTWDFGLSQILNIPYPRCAAENNIEGIVYVSFDILKSGRVDNLKIEKSPHRCLNETAIGAVLQMPYIRPFPADFPDEKLTFTLPINFELFE